MGGASMGQGGGGFGDYLWEELWGGGLWSLRVLGGGMCGVGEGGYGGFWGI